MADLAGTLLHECCHQYHNVKDIKGCNGKIHNKKFKALAEKVGFRVEKSKECGFGHTYVDPDTELMDFIVNEIKPNGEIFKYAREATDSSTLKPRKKNSFAYVCGSCGMKAKAKEGANLMCSDCEESMEMQED